MTTAGLFFSHVRSNRIDHHFARLVAETGSLFEWRFAYNPGNGANPQVALEYLPAQACMAKRHREFLRNGGVQNGLMDVAILPLVVGTEAEYVWILEYDVEFTGNWSRFFEQFRENPADLLTSTIVPYSGSKDWSHWARAIPPKDVPREVWHRAFHPVMRLSRRFALWYQQQMNQTVWGGHYEYTLPTSALWAGFVVEDLGGEGPFCPQERRGRNYINTPTDWSLAPGTLLWRPFRDQYFSENPTSYEHAETLYHPVKADVPDWSARKKTWSGRLWGWFGSR